MDALQLDALREMATIGAGNAARALSELYGDRRVTVRTPAVQVVPLARVAEAVGGDRPVSAVVMPVAGTGGWMGLVFFDDGLEQLCRPLVPDSEDDLLRSGMVEVGNITLTAYLDALAAFTDRPLRPGIPELVEDSAASLMTSLLAAAQRVTDVILMAAQFELDGSHLEGQLLFLPEEEDLQALFRRLGMDL
ncbi:chemotaxis protein CheC [Limnochorda pilosa]|uniref:chemotaxis protein CheC n=1 Tax=Limnochorda pilosa TaxID=1555112 RepID=UPI0026EA8BD1|nr:chemotaxis protein CheC [Limnochorda pilosa]